MRRALVKPRSLLVKFNMLLELKKDKKSDQQVVESTKRPESKSLKNTVDPRDSFRPKAFTKEEKDSWKVYSKQITDFYGDLIMKQFNQNEGD